MSVPSSIKDMVPDRDVVLALEPEMLAEAVLRFVAANPRTSGFGSRHNFLVHAKSEFENDSEVALAFAEAWAWLEREGLLVREPGNSSGSWFVLTRRGRQLASGERSFEDFRAAQVLPKGLLHSALTGVWPEFLRGDLESAVFKAFKEVEVAVRSASSLPKETCGRDLMRRAFHPKSGALTDMAAPIAEREGMSALFDGAISVFKNPSSHHRVKFDDPRAVGELLLFASHLLRIADRAMSDRPGEESGEGAE